MPSRSEWEEGYPAEPLRARQQAAPEEVVTTPFGRFLVTRGELIGETLRAGTLWDGPGFLQPLAIEYAQLGTRGVTVIDVGANCGSFSIWLAAHGAWRVVAVEPVPEALRLLKANLDLNKPTCADRVIPVEVAAWHRRARLSLAAPIDPGNLGGTALVEDDPAGLIQGGPLDDLHALWIGGVSLIKIDAQGSDFAALQGLAQTIDLHHPTIVFEWEAGLAQVHGHTLPQVEQWLAARGYQLTPWPCYANNYLATMPRIR